MRVLYRRLRMVGHGPGTRKALAGAGTLSERLTLAKNISLQRRDPLSEGTTTPLNKTVAVERQLPTGPGQLLAGSATT